MGDLLLQLASSLFPLTFQSVMVYGSCTGLIIGGIMLVTNLKSELPSRRPTRIPTPRAKYHRS